jgi:D-alanyl-D-alanine carboxypeptidase
VRRRAPTASAVAAVTTVVALALAGCTSSGKPAAAVTSAPVATTASPTPSPTPTPTPSATKARAADTLPAVALAGAEPKIRFPSAAPAVGSGAHASVSSVPSSLWDRMVGYSWTPGCPVGRNSLRLVQVNYWGFDGIRHRGSVVVASTITSRTVSAFTTLYDLHFRIRQMRPMDSTWGHNPKGPGADDYAAMDADNTSAFNCRYVGGEESRKVWSNHAYGRAIDINDFENPYVDSSGKIYPTSYFLHRRSGAGIFSSSSSAAVRAFTRVGFFWGGRWSDPDFQHMEIQ